MRCLRIIKEMNRDGGTVTITSRGRPVAVLSPVPASEETHSGFIGMMRGTVVKYEDPFEPATSPSDWSALRWSCLIILPAFVADQPRPAR